jgi:S-DNA-T family DNA segregation ATPase FtsK/SpoIIIE
MGIQASRSQDRPNFIVQYYQRLKEALLILLSAMGLFLTVSFMSYNLGDPGWSTTGTHQVVHNLTGRFGAWEADVLLSLFGYFAYWLPFSLFYMTYVAIVYPERYQNATKTKTKYIIIRVSGFILTLIFGTGLLDLHFNEYGSKLPIGTGGLLGSTLTRLVLHYCGELGSTILFLGLFLVGLTLATGISWFRVIDWLGKKVLELSSHSRHGFLKLLDFSKESYHNFRLNQDKKAQTQQIEDLRKTHSLEAAVAQPAKLPTLEAEASVPAKIKTKIQKIIKKKPAAPIAQDMPPLRLLEESREPHDLHYPKEVLEEMSRLVELKLADFGIEAQVVGVRPGPVIIRFEIQLAPGIKVSKVTTLSKDLARSLSITSVRIVEVIPGKPYVGLEIPKEQREVVRLRQIIASEQYAKTNAQLPLAIGKDIAGRSVVLDLTRMPHLLVAGTTGSGKSVGVNAMLLSLLFNASPDEVRLIMIDPKMLELSLYDGIPHLLTPVVTDMKEAANALRWCVGEMEYRYQLMAALGVRNLATYNKLVAEAQKNGAPILDPLWDSETSGGQQPQELTPLPYIVVIIDEFADMIMVVGRKVEELIARIAQKARAAGIHMIIATQRPSVDVITGLIKANIPTRIAYQVSSKIDSRTILDQQGAEQLLGQGDMLYLPPGSGVPKRLHGAFVADQEVHAVVGFWKQQRGPDYVEDVVNVKVNVAGLPKLNTDDDTGQDDPLYREVIEFVAEYRKASISSVQRRFKIGYNRAARLIEQMEEDGLVSPMQSNGTREILMNEKD